MQVNIEILLIYQSVNQRTSRFRYVGADQTHTALMQVLSSGSSNNIARAADIRYRRIPKGSTGKLIITNYNLRLGG
jgi:hypothetical protein